MFDTNVAYAISDKSDGNMAFLYGAATEVVANRGRFLAGHGIAPEECVWLVPEHEDAIRVVGAADTQDDILDPDGGIPAEALLTNERGVILFLLTADCFPVTYYDPTRQAIALAHLGWRPADTGLAASVVARMKSEYGCTPRDIRVHIGPGIHAQSYVLERPRQQSDPKWRPYLIPAHDGTSVHIDLVAYIRDQLEMAGIANAHIGISPVDTCASTNMFSHYRAQRNSEAEGRFATVIGLRK